MPRWFHIVVEKIKNCCPNASPARRELILILVACLLFFIFCVQVQFAESLVVLLVGLEGYEMDELIPTTAFGLILLGIYGYRRFREAAEEVKARRQAEAEIEHLALHDALTGLPNRILIERHLDGLLNRVPDKGLGSVGVFFVDLDNFKAINDTLGHHVGDELLQAVARRIQSGLRQEEDFVGRHAGDEFIALIPTSEAEAAEYFEKVAGRILTALQRPFRVGTELVVVKASVGIARAPRDGLTTTDLLKRSDVAMYSAKRQGRNRFAIYNESAEEEAAIRINANDLDTALQHEQGQFRLLYQPYYSLETGEIKGVEALARWNHPRFGEISPSYFIPLAERSGLMVILGQKILQEALQDMFLFRQRFPEDFTVNVNVSGVELGTERFLEKIQLMVTSLDLTPRCIRLEVTESCFLSDNVRALRNICDLYEAGFSLALDDFGTGYSSINHFIDVPLDVVKLDRSLVHRIEQSPQGLDVIHGLIKLFNELSIDVVAEGVETEGQQQLLADCHCSMVQGYLYARPMPLKDLLERSGPLSFIAS